MSGHLKYDATTGHLLYEPDGHLVYQCVFTAANADLVVGPASLTASATFTVPAFTATSVLTAGAATLSALAEVAVENYVAVALLQAAPATLSASATFDAPVYTASSTLTVGAATLSAAATHGPSDCLIDPTCPTSGHIGLIVWTTPSVGYVFINDLFNRFSYRKTTDGGESWSGLFNVNAGSLATASVWYDRWTAGGTGTVIHLWYAMLNDDVLYYRSFDTSTDTLGTQRTVYAGSVFTTTTSFVSGTKTRGGNLLVGFGLNTGELGLYRSTDSGVNWSARTNPVEAYGDTAMLFPGNAADSQDAAILYQDASANELTLKVHDDSANSNSESSVIMTLNEQGFGLGSVEQFGFAGAIRHGDGHLIVAAVSEFDASTSDFRVFDINGTGSITEKTALATNKANIYWPQVYIDSAGRIYVAYIGKRDGSETVANTGNRARVYYSLSTDGGSTWGNDEIVSADLGDWRDIWCAPAGPNFSVVWTQGNNRLWLNCRTGIATHTATAALTAPAAILSAVGVGDTDYVATAALTAPAARLVAVAQHAGEVFHTGTATLTVGAATLSATSTVGTTTHTATSTLTVGAAFLVATATHDQPGQDATGVLIAPPATLSASATHTEPTYTATSALTAPAATLTGAAFIAEANIGTATLEAGPATLSATATFAERTYSATSALTAPAATLSASATFTEPVSESIGTAALTVGAATLIASATHDPRTYTGTSALTAPAATVSGSATFTEAAGEPCENCSGDFPASKVVRLCGTITNISCGICASITGDYVLTEGGVVGGNCVLQYQDPSFPCGSLDMSLRFFSTEIAFDISIGSLSGSSQFKRTGLTAPYDCRTAPDGFYTLSFDSSSECTFGSMTVEVNPDPVECEHCTITPESLTLIFDDGFANNNCESCAALGNTFLLTNDPCGDPCIYTYSGTSDCGSVLITLTLGASSITGFIEIDGQTHATLLASVSAPYDASALRTLSVSGVPGNMACDLTGITSATIEG